MRAQKRFVLSHKALSFLNSLISKTFLRNVDFHPGICDQVTFCARLTDHFKAAAVNEEWGGGERFVFYFNTSIKMMTMNLLSNWVGKVAGWLQVRNGSSCSKN